MRDLPSLLETFSYIFYFPSCIIGPSFEFIDFIRYIRKEKEYKNIPIKRCMKKGFNEFLIALFWTLSFVLLHEKLNPFWASSDEFAEKSYIFKILYVTFSIPLTVRAKYYIAFKISESSIIFSGLGYNLVEVVGDKNSDEKKTDFLKEDFYKITNVEIKKYEFDLNPNHKINSWNKSVTNWLKYHLFFRLLNMDNKFLKNFSIATLITFLFSASWHGFFPGYYLTFVQVFLIQQISKILESKYDFFNRLENGNLIVKWIYIFFMSFCFSYFCFSFIALNFTDSFKFYKSFYFIPNISLIIFVLFIVFSQRKKNKNKN